MVFTFSSASSFTIGSNDSLFDSNERRQTIGFNNTDSVMNDNGLEEKVSAPKNISRLEEISRMNNERRKLEEEENEDDGDEDEDSDDYVDKLSIDMSSEPLNNIELEIETL